VSEHSKQIFRLPVQSIGRYAEESPRRGRRVGGGCFNALQLITLHPPLFPHANPASSLRALPLREQTLSPVKPFTNPGERFRSRVIWKFCKEKGGGRVEALHYLLLFTLFSCSNPMSQPLVSKNACSVERKSKVICQIFPTYLLVWVTTSPVMTRRCNSSHTMMILSRWDAWFGLAAMAERPRRVHMAQRRRHHITVTSFRIPADQH
jgi:hypothetical protein